MDEPRQRETLSFAKVAKRKPRSRFLKWNLDNPLIVWGFIVMAMACIVVILGANIGADSGVIDRADIGTIAAHEYKAPRDFTFDRVDTEATEKKREERVAAVLPIYNWDNSYHDTVVSRIRSAFAMMRSGMADEEKRLKTVRVDRDEDYALRQDSEAKQNWVDAVLGRFADAEPFDSYLSTRAMTQSEATDGIVSWFLQHQKSFEKILGGEVSEDMFIWLSSQQFSEQIEEGIISVIDTVLGRMIMTSYEEIDANEAFVVQWYEMGEKRQRRMEQTAKNNIATLVSSETLIQTLLRERFEQAPDSMIQYFKQFVRTNVSYDEASTQRERQNVSAKTQELKYTLVLKKGQTIVNRGEPITQTHYEIFEELAKGQNDTENSYVHWIALGMVAVLLTFLCWRSILATTSRRQKNRDVVYLTASVLTYVLFLKICALLCETLDTVYHWPYSMMLLFPFASAPMVLRIVVSRYYAYLVSVCGIVLTGLVVDDSLIMLYAAMNMMAGCLLMERPKRSNMLTQRGFLVGVVSGLTAFAIYQIRGDSMTLTDNVVVTALGVASGLMATGIVLIALPLAESLFGYVTSNKLLELSNLEHPALKTLFLEAPGTYQHSIMVGSLNEAAADAIGANAILARVGGYYHDIGKVKNAQYFAENQRGDNPHNRLKPNMSALILKAHERDGLDIARKYKLPQDIMDFIATHHGTSRIEFFYQRAKEQQERVQEEDYRYPGPRPQTRETGICMVSDMVEAAVRSLPDKSPDKILVLVHKLINHKFTDGQFDECDLTLRDLNDIANALIGILNAFYHHRPEYPDQKKEREKQEAEKREKQEKQEADKKAEDAKNDKNTSSKVMAGSDKSSEIEKTAEKTSADALKKSESAEKSGNTDKISDDDKNDKDEKRESAGKMPPLSSAEENVSDGAREAEEANALLKEEGDAEGEKGKAPTPDAKEITTTDVQNTYELTFSSKVDVFKKS